MAIRRCRQMGQSGEVGYGIFALGMTESIFLAWCLSIRLAINGGRKCPPQ